MKPQVKAFFHEPTFTLTYVVYDPSSKDAVVIDPVLDFDALTWRTSTEAAQEVLEFARSEGLNVHWILDTHAHADHLTGMELLKDRFEAHTAIGARINVVQQTFAKIFNLPASFAADGSQFDRLLHDGDTIEAGSLTVEALHTPGHTPACFTFKIGDAIFTGDAIFLPDYGTGRCDFPAGSAEQLYDSIVGKIYSLPDSTRLFVGHDYQPGGREVRWESSVGESKEKNIQLKATTSKEEFVEFRTQRDATLKPPRLILQSLQVNIEAGKLPGPESNGIAYFRMPINFLGGKR